MSTHVIEVLVDLLEHQTSEATEARAAERLLCAEVEDLERDLAEVKQERDEQSDDLIALDNEVMDLRDRLKTAEGIASKRLQMIDDLESEIEGLNEFVSGLDTLVKDQDWYELRGRFGYADVAESSPTGWPEYLETEKDYESAPVGTRTKGRGYAPFERVKDGWLGDISMKIHPHSFMAGVRLKVDRWGTGSANGLANGL